MILRLSLFVLIMFLAIAPALFLASDLGRSDGPGKWPVHGSLGKLPWASGRSVFTPSLEIAGPALVTELLHRLSPIPHVAFVPPRH